MRGSAVPRRGEQFSVAAPGTQQLTDVAARFRDTPHSRAAADGRRRPSQAPWSRQGRRRGARGYAAVGAGALLAAGRRRPRPQEKAR